MPTRAASSTRPKLDRDAVIDAALALSDDEGLEALTIRRLAQTLSVTPMAMYWHFRDKEALLAGIGDRMWAEAAAALDAAIAAVPAGDPDRGWIELRSTLEALVAVMRAHPAVAPLVPAQVVSTDAGLAITERTLAFFADQGFGLAPAAELARYVLCSAVMLVSQQPGAEIQAPEDKDAALRAKRAALSALPADRYPHVVAAADHLTDCAAPDAYYARGVDLVIAGIRDQVPGTPVRRARRARTTAGG